SDATNALQSLVSRLRRSLRSGNGSVLESHPAGYRLVVERDDVDVYRFEQLAARGRDELKSGQPAAASATLRAALELWRGPAMVAGLGVGPSDELRQVHLAVLRRDPTLAPADPTAPVGGSRLPARLTSFVGRETELREGLARLSDARLVTLVGPGGAGKTRLS